MANRRERRRSLWILGGSARTSFVVAFCMVTTLLLLDRPQVDCATNFMKPGVSELLNLFRLNGKRAGFWGSNIFRGNMDRWTRHKYKLTNPEELANYTRSSSIAHFLGLSPIDAIYMPIPVNVFFVGFNKDGNHGLEINEQDIRHWFEHMDHVLQHTRVPSSMAKSAGKRLNKKVVTTEEGEEEEEEEEGRGRKGEKEERTSMSAFSFVHHNFSCHAIDVGPNVTEVFEMVIRVLARKEDPKSKNESTVEWGEDVYHVDVDAMVALMNSLINQLDLQYAYNIFVLNPKRFHHKYGYRAGFSTAELDVLAENPGLIPSKLPKGWSSDLPAVALERDSRWGRRKAHRPDDKFLWKLLDSKEVESWVSTKMFALTEIRVTTLADENDPVSILRKRARQVLDQKSSEYSRDLRRFLYEHDSGLHADCLVDSWVSNERAAFVDLTAGPFSWGPFVRGEGVRAETTLPSVENTFAGLNGYAENETDFDKELEDLAAERFSTMSGSEDTGGSVHHDVEMLMAELDVYAIFARRHCGSGRKGSKGCEEVNDRVMEMQEELHKLELEVDGEQKKDFLKAALERAYSWSASIEGDDDGNAVTQEQHAEAPSLAHDIFLSHVGAVLSKAMHHVIAPPMAEGPRHARLHVSFHIYVVHPQGAFAREHLFPIDDFKHEVMKLKTSLQDFRFVVHKLSVADDAALGVAFTSSLRTCSVALLLDNGKFLPASRDYIDSATLEHQLQRMGEEGTVSVSPQYRSKSTQWRLREQLDVPVFVFSLHGHTPLFIDKELTAKSLSNMVVVVQSDEPDWASLQQCNRKTVRTDLRNPLKGALAAVAEHLTGVLPTHKSFSHAYARPEEDWMWAVGAHALAATSSRGWKMSQFHIDAGWRNYIIVGMDEAIHRVNEGIRILSKEATHENTFHFLNEFRLDWMMGQYQTVVELWTEMTKEMDHLGYDRAIHHLNHLEYLAKSFLGSCKDLSQLVHPVRCIRKRTLKGGILLASINGSAAIVVVLYLILRRRKVKAKIN